MVTFAGEFAYGFRPGTTTRANLDALRERHPAAYADPKVVVSTPTNTIGIARAYKVPPRGTQA